MMSKIDENSFVELEILSSISKLIGSAEGENRNFEEIFKLLSRLVPFESATLFLFDEAKQELSQIVEYGGGVDLAENFTFGMGKGLSSYVAEELRPILLPNLHDGPRFAGSSLRSFLSIPMLMREKLVGVINFGHSEPEIFEQSHVDYLQIVAAQLAGIILELDYMKKLKENNQRLEETNAALKDAQDKLIEAEKMATLGHVTAGLNHEINNPLAVISGHLQLLELEQDNLPEEIMNRIGILMKEVDRISDVLKNLQKVKKIVLSDYTDQGVHMLDIKKSISS